MRLFKSPAWSFLQFLLIFYSPFTFAQPQVGDAELDALLALDLEELIGVNVNIASKRSENIHNAPGIITVVSAKDIRKFGARNLADVINRLTNTNIVSSNVHPNGATAMRGGLLTHIDNHVAILINGRPMRESQAGGINSDFYLAWPVEIIERIEIIRGPGSVLYGTNAFTGVLNFVTKQAPEELEINVSARYGSFDTKEVTVYGGVTLGDFSLYGGLKYLDIDGWNFSAVDGAGVRGSMNSAKDGELLTLQAKYKGFTLNTIFSDTDQNTNAPAFRFPEESSNIDRQFIDLGYVHEFSEDWSVSGNLTFNGHRFGFPINGAPTISNFDSSGWLAELSTNARLTDNITLVAGGVFDVLRGDISLGTGGKYHTNRKSAYVQADYQVLDWLKLVGGVQWNKPKEVGSDLAPRFGIIANLDDKWGMKLLYGEAYRAGFGGQIFQQTAFFAGNSNLAPETVQTFDAQISYNSPSFELALTFYYSKISDIHIRVANAMGITNEANGGSIESHGFELEGKARLGKKWSLQGSASNQTNKDDQGRRDAKLGSNLMIKIGLNYEHGNGISLGLFNSYFGDAGKIEHLVPGVSVVNPPADAYSLLTGNLNINLPELLGKHNMPDTTFSLYLDNLLDEDIFQPDINTKVVNTIPTYSGRAVYGTVTVKF